MEEGTLTETLTHNLALNMSVIRNFSAKENENFVLTEPYKSLVYWYCNSHSKVIPRSCVLAGYDIGDFTTA
jgi:hypothetical protein